MKKAAEREEQGIQEIEQGEDREPDGRSKPHYMDLEFNVNVPVGHSGELKMEPAPAPSAELLIRTQEP